MQNVSDKKPSVPADLNPLSISSTSSKKKKTLDDYDFIPGRSGELGKGSYASVKLVREKEDPSQTYALKIVSLDFMTLRNR